MENLWSLVALIACPVGMGLMMWMMRGNRQHATGPSHASVNIPGQRQARLGASA